MIVLLLAGNALLVWSWMRLVREAPVSREVPPATLRAVVQVPPATTLALGRGPSVALSPDGRRLVYTAESSGKVELYLRTMDRFDSTPIPGTEGATDPFFSPDGRWLGFFAGDKLKKIPIEGGAAVTLADAPTPRGHAWGFDDAIVLTPRDNTGLWRVPANGGKLEPVTTLADGDVSHRWPQVLPGGKGLLYTIWSGSWEPAQIAVQPLDGGPRRVVVTGGGFGRFVGDETANDGYLIYARAEGLMAVPFDLSRLQVTGEPVAVVDGVITNLSGGANFAVSTSGLLAYVSAGGEDERELVWVARNGTTTPAAKLRGMSRWYDLSQDGTRLARYKSEGATRDVWTEDLVKGASTRITVRADPVSSGSAERLNAVWSADGRHLAYSAGVPLNLFCVPADGGGQEERLTTSRNMQWPGSWSPDGRTLTYVEVDPLSGSDIWVLTLDAAQKPQGARPLLSTPFSESAPMISPDGRWLAYQSNESGRYEVYVQPFPDGGRRWQVSADEGVYPRWSPRGDELFFRSGPTRAGMTAVPVKAAPDFQPGAPHVLFEARRYESIFDASPDGGLFLMMPALGPAAAQVSVVVNWLAELRAKLPGGQLPTPK